MAKSPDSSKEDKTTEHYERLGRQFEALFMDVEPKKSRLFWLNLWLGVLRGFGAVLGATIGIAILLWVLSMFSHIPLIGPVVNDVKQTVKSAEQ